MFGAGYVKRLRAQRAVWLFRRREATFSVSMTAAATVARMRGDRRTRRNLNVTHASDPSPSR
jgi:hypothetical protein